MNTTHNIPINNTDNFVNHKTMRQEASLTRSEFLLEGVVHIHKLIRHAFIKRKDALHARNRELSKAR